MNRLFGTAPIALASWAWIIGVAFAIHAIVQVEKTIRRWRERARAPGPTC
jgi:hypothetical protein